MKKYTLISSQISSCNYREDDWQIIRSFSNEDELLELLKEGYLEDAKKRNNYPIVSHYIDRNFTYQNLSKHDGFTWLGGDYYDDESYDYDEDIFDFRDSIFEEDQDIRNKFKKSFERFEKWEKRIKSLIPKLREKSQKLEKIRKEQEMLFELANKYNYELKKI